MKTNTDMKLGLTSIIGNTPLIELIKLNGKPGVRILGKLEGNNPGGSVKDRAAYYMLKKARESGELTGNKAIIEPTSGNTGIALAMLGAAWGFKVKLFMPECVSTERQLVLQAFGAEVMLTPAKEATDGAIRRAHKYVEEHREECYMPNQFENEANVLAHYETTGPEILRQTGGEVDVFVAGMGTGGTLMGVRRFMKEKKPSVKIVGVEPTVGHTIQGLKNMTESMKPAIYHEDRLDEKIVVEDGEAFETTRLLAVKEGIFVGMSSGAAVAGALRIAEKMQKGTIVALLPDRGDRYLSTTLFRSICARCPP